MVRQYHFQGGVCITFCAYSPEGVRAWGVYIEAPPTATPPVSRVKPPGWICPSVRVSTGSS